MLCFIGIQGWSPIRGLEFCNLGEIMPVKLSLSTKLIINVLLKILVTFTNNFSLMQSSIPIKMFPKRLRRPIKVVTTVKDDVGRHKMMNFGRSGTNFIQKRFYFCRRLVTILSGMISRHLGNTFEICQSREHNMVQYHCVAGLPFDWLGFSTFSTCQALHLFLLGRIQSCLT